MSLADIFIHLLNVVAPAMACALVLPWAARLMWHPKSSRWDLWTQMLVLWSLGMVVVFGGLWSLGRDGKMMTYTALVCIQATAQWLMMRGWRR